MLKPKNKRKKHRMRDRGFLDLEGTLPPLKMTTEEIREKALEEMAKETAAEQISGKSQLGSQ